MWFKHVLRYSFLLIVVLAVSNAARSNRKKRQAPAQQMYPRGQYAAAPYPPSPVQRYAYVPVDAAGRPMSPMLPQAMMYPPPRPPPPMPRMLPQRTYLPPPPPPRIIRRPSPPRRQVIVQARPPPPPEFIVVEAAPLPECGTPAQPGKCCKDPFSCPEAFQVEEESMACFHDGPAAVCCTPNICD